MNKLFFIFTISILGSFAIFAQGVASNSIGVTPDAIDNVIAFVLNLASSIPAIGSYLALALKIAGIAAAVLTAVSSLLFALSSVLGYAGLVSAKKYVDLVLPYVQYFSMFNVQKKV